MFSPYFFPLPKKKKKERLFLVEEKNVFEGGETLIKMAFFLKYHSISNQ